MFTEFKAYLSQEFVLFNDNRIPNRALHPEQKGEANTDVLICKLKRFDFENALRDVENWRLERLTDIILEIPVFQSWSRKNARKLLQCVKYEKVLKSWEKVQ